MKVNWKSLKESTIMLMIVITISKITGIVREVVLANYYGTSDVSDAYLTASYVITHLFFFIGNALATSYIPIFSKVKEQNGEKRALYYSNNIMNISLFISCLVIFILAVFPEFIVRIFAYGFNRETVELTSRLIRISTPSLLFMVVISVLSGFLQSKNNYLAPAAVSLPRNLVLIVSIYLSIFWGIDILAVGFLLAYFIEVLFLIPFTLSKKYRYSFVFDLKEENLSQTMSMVIPVLIGTFVSRINGIIDKSIASSTIEGGVSALSYANVINTGINEILVTGIITILFVNCSEYVAKGEHDKLKKQVELTIENISFLLIPATVGVVVLAKPIVTFFLCRGSFNEQSVILTTGPLIGYILGLVFSAYNGVFVKVLYSYKDTKKSTIISTISIGINLILNFILSRYLGLTGLALSTSIATVISSFAYLIHLKKKIGFYISKNTVSVILKSLITSIVMGIITYYLFKVLSIYLGGLFAVVISIVVGFISYIGLSFIVKNKPLVGFIKKIYQKR